MGQPRRSRFALLFLAGFSLIFLAVYGIGGLEGVEQSWQDWMFLNHGDKLKTADSRIIIAAIDEDTLKRFGLPPSRRMHAQLLGALKREGVKTVCFDVLFLEARPFDKELAQATKDFGRVVHLFKIDHPDDANAAPAVSLPVQGVVDSAQFLALPNIDRVLDGDGHLRRIVMYEERVRDPKRPGRPALLPGAAMYASWSAVDPIEIEKRYPKILFLNFRPPQEWDAHAASPDSKRPKIWSAYRTLSIIDIIDGKLTVEQKSALKNSAVFIGSTATGYFDHYPTPFSSSVPGVESHALAMDNALNDDFLRPLPMWLTILVILAFIWLPLALGETPALVEACVVAGVLVAWYFFAGWALVRARRVEFAAPAAALLISYVALTVHRLLVEGREKRFIKTLFGQFVAPEVVADLARDPSKVKLGGEKKDMTIFFLDIAHFTTISEKMPPEALIIFLNKYLSALTQVIHDRKGVVDKYMGDCIMAFWNAPLPLPNHRVQACLAAIECQTMMDKLNETLEPGMPEVPAVRIGLNAGQVTVGLTGSEKKLQYTVIGDEVNLASRLEGANKFFGSRIMASEAVYDGARDFVEARELGRVRVVGKTAPIKVFELIAKKGELTDDWRRGLELYRKGLDLFERRRYAEAAVVFQEFIAIFPNDGPAALYLNATRDYAAIPPDANWDGVFNLTAK